jgi:LacI family transcriptional regulator
VPPLRGRVTLATVAASAGVSVATVSKVLNGRSDVSESTRARPTATTCIACAT